MFKIWNNYLTRIFFVFGIILLLFSCDGRPKGLVSQSKMADVLTDMHKAEAIMSEKGISNEQYSAKSPYYKFVLDKYHISQAEFDSSLVWYTKNPQKFENIYDDVLNQLTDFQKEIQHGKYHKIDSTEMYIRRDNIWNKQSHYAFMKDSARTKLDFEISNPALLYGDVYILKFQLRIAKEDSCENIGIKFRIHYRNGIIESVFRKSFNDNLRHKYIFSVPAKRKIQIHSISGELLSSTKYKGSFNVRIDSITLVRKYNIKLQDSLRNVVEFSTRILKESKEDLNRNKVKNVLNHRFIHR